MVAIVAAQATAQRRPLAGEHADGGAQLHPMLTRLAVTGAASSSLSSPANHGSGSNGNSVASQPQPSSSPSSSTATEATSSHHHHHHHPNSIKSQNSSSLANLCCFQAAASVKPASLSCKVPISSSSSSSSQQDERQQVANIKLQNLNLNNLNSHNQYHPHQPSSSRLNWRNSSSTLATTRATPSGVHYQAIRLHRKSLLAQQRAEAASGSCQSPAPTRKTSGGLVNCQSTSSTSAAGGKLVALSLVPTSLSSSSSSSSALLSRTSGCSASVRDALVSSRSRQAGSKLSNQQRQPATTVPASVTNSRVRQGALYARRQYPHPTQQISSASNVGLKLINSSANNNPTPSKFHPHYNNHQLLRSTESSQSLVQLDCGSRSKTSAASNYNRKQLDQQQQQTISGASSRFSLNSSTSSLSLAVVKRAKPSPQVKSSATNSRHHHRLALYPSSSSTKSESPIPIRTRSSASGGHQHQISQIRGGLKEATVGGQVRSDYLLSSERRHQTHTLGTTDNSGSASAHGTVGTEPAVGTRGANNAASTTTSRNNQNNLAVGANTTNSDCKCKQNQPITTQLISNLAGGNINIDNNITNNNNNNNPNSNHPILEDQILVSNKAKLSSGDCLALSPRATVTSERRPTTTINSNSRLPVVNSSLSRGSQPELGSRKASIGSGGPTSLLGASSGQQQQQQQQQQIDKSNNMISSNNQQQQAHNTNETRTNCDDNNVKETLIASNIMQGRQSIDSQPIKADFLNNNNHSQLLEKTTINDKSPLGLHQSSNQIAGGDKLPIVNGSIKQASIKFHQVPAGMMAQPDSLEQQQHADENQPPSQTVSSEHLIMKPGDEGAKCEHENIVEDDDCDHKTSIATKAASAEREIIAVVDELNNCCDTRSEAGSTDSRSKTMDYQEEVEGDINTTTTMVPPTASTETQATREVASRYPSSISMQRSDSLESNLESVEDQMVLGSPLVSPPPSELDVDVDEDNMIERGETPPSSFEAQPELLIGAPKIALKQLPNDIIMLPVDIPIRQEPICDYYDLEARPFARGKFAQVKRCVSKISQKCFAAKCIKKRRRSTDIRHEILLEIEALKLSYHTNCIVKLYEVYETATEMILILEMANGGELQRVLDDEEAIAEKLVKQMVRQILDGLILLHDSNIAHLDIKPQNLLLTESFPDGAIKLCDFGISRRITKDCEIREICGTPDYVAPEILRYDPISLATDMWSLGVLTYVLLTGYSPFGSDSKQQTFCNITQAKLDFPSEIFDKISQDAIDFMQKLIIREPSDRLTSRQARVHPWLSNN